MLLVTVSAGAQSVTDAPRIDGLRVWPTSLADAPDSIRRAWTLFERARGDRLAPPADRMLVTLDRWSRAELAPWLERRRAALAEIDALTSAAGSSGDANALLFAALLHGLLVADLAHALAGAPLPAEVEADADLRAWHRSQLMPALEAARTDAARALRVCALAAGRASEALRDWESRCLAEARRTAALELSAASERAPESAPEVARCDDRRTGSPFHEVRRLRWGGLDDDDASLDLTHALRAREDALERCFGPHHRARYRIAWTVGQRGQVRRVDVEQVPRGDAVRPEPPRACIVDAMRAATWSGAGRAVVELCVGE